MRFLIDTCVISEGRRGSSEARRWLETAPLQASFLSAITVGEVVRGIEMLRRRDQGSASVLQSWLGRVRGDYRGRILPVTEAVAVRWGELAAMRSRPLADGLIAATALVHGLAVVTRDVADFADAGVVVVDPWETA